MLKRYQLLSFIFILFVLSCGGLDQNAKENRSTLDSVSSVNLWPRGVSIPICWTTPGFLNEKNVVGNAIAAEYEGKTPLRFIWHGKCQDAPAVAIRIGIVTDAKERPSSFIGPFNNNGNPTMFLNFGSDRCSGSFRNNCLQWDALHEFGHAIGFEHEQDRMDGECNKEPSKTGKGISLGNGEDKDSVMNYCKTFFNTNVVVHLSPRDIDAVHYVYGGGYFAFNGATHFKWREKFCSFPFADMYEMHRFAFSNAANFGALNPGSAGLQSKGACELPAGYFAANSATFFTNGAGKSCGFLSELDYHLHQMQFHRINLPHFGILNDTDMFLGSQGACDPAVVEPFFIKAGNNGTKSCTNFCATEGGSSCALAQRRDTEKILSCQDTPGLLPNGATLLCWCLRS